MNQHVETFEYLFGNEENITDDMRVEIGEMIQSEIEKEGNKYLDYILKDDISFMSDDIKRMGFFMFVFFQYFRIKVIRDRNISKLSSESAKLIDMYKKEFNFQKEFTVDWVNIYNYGYIALINNVVTSLESTIKINVLKSDGARFITCGQPIFNLLNKHEKMYVFLSVRTELFNYIVQ